MRAVFLSAANGKWSQAVSLQALRLERLLANVVDVLAEFREVVGVVHDLLVEAPVRDEQAALAVFVHLRPLRAHIQRIRASAFVLPEKNVPRHAIVAKAAHSAGETKRMRA